MVHFHAMNIAAIAAILLGLVVCFFGYRLVRAVLALAGFAVGAIVGLTAVAAIPGTGQLAVLIAAGVGGIIGAVLSAALYKVGVFALGALAGLMLSTMLPVVGLPAPLWLVRAACALGLGLLALLIERPMLSICTALAGAWSAVAGVFVLLGRYSVWIAPPRLPAFDMRGWVGPAMLAAWLFLALVGAATQLRARHTRNSRPSAKVD